MLGIFIFILNLVMFFVKASTRTLAKIRSELQQQFTESTTSMIVSRTYKKNAAKPELLRLLFATYVKSNWATNGRQKRTICYWLFSFIKRLNFKPDIDPAERQYEALFELFQRCLKSHQEKSTKNTVLY